MEPDEESPSSDFEYFLSLQDGDDPEGEDDLAPLDEGLDDWD